MQVTKAHGTVSWLPLPKMRVMAALMRPCNATLGQQVHAGISVDTLDMSFNLTEMRRRYPTMPFTSLAEVAQRDDSEEG